MWKYHCLNPISSVGLQNFSEAYEKTENLADSDAVLVRSAAMHEMDLPENLKAVARAGAGVNNIPLDQCAQKGIVVFNTPGANANAVKEIVLAGMLLASRDIVGGIEWVKQEKENENVAKLAEKQKKKYDAEGEACSTFCSTFGFEKWNTHFSCSSASSNDSRKSRSTFVFEPKRSPSRLHRLPRENHLSMFHLFHFFPSPYI